MTNTTYTPYPFHNHDLPVPNTMQNLTLCRCGSRFDEGSRITFEKDQALCDTCKMSGVKSSASKHVCAACHKNIVGTSIYAMEKEWHMNCFTCQVNPKQLLYLIA